MRILLTFQFHNKASQQPSVDDYSMPHWINLRFVFAAIAIGVYFTKSVNEKTSLSFVANPI